MLSSWLLLMWELEGILSPSLAAPQSASPGRYQTLGSDPEKGEMASLSSGRGSEAADRQGCPRTGVN